MINKAWQTRPLGELFDIGAGKTMSAAARDGASKTPFLRTSNVFWDDIDLSTVDEMAIPEHELADKLLRPGDLLVCEGGEIGRAAIWNGETEVISFQNHLHRLRPLRADIEPRFYVYFLQAGFTQLGIFEGAGNKTTIPNLSRNRLAALYVPHPSIDEQRSIVQALARLHEAIKVHEQSMSVTQELKRATMRELFTRGLLGEPQKETEIGLVPQHWEVASLADVSSLSTGTTPSTKNAEYYVGDVPFVRTAEIVNNRIFDAASRISRQAVLDYSLRIYPPGTVLMAMYGQGKTRGQVGLLEVAASTTQNAAAIEPNKDVDPEFLWHFLFSKYDSLRGMGSLGHLSHLNLGYLREVVIPKPPLTEQREVCQILNAIDRKIALHKKKRATLDELFKALLHKLMTGEISAADLELSALCSKAEAAA